VKKTVIYATTCALAMGPTASFADSTCGGASVISTEATLATEMTHIMVCDPQGAPVGHFESQEWHSGGATGGTIQEFSDPGRVPYGTYTLGQDGGGFGTISYTYDGSSTPQYVVAVSGSTMYYCLESDGSLQYTTSFKLAAAPAACP
jgi:hypothetical protein